jgi:DNA replication protein DnaC
VQTGGTLLVISDSEQIAIAKTDGFLIKWLNQIKKVQLIILDDFGIQPIAQGVKLILLQILEDRYEEGSIIICSQAARG